MTIPLTYLTARPMLEYLLGLEAYEMPTVRPDHALPIFCSFLGLAQDPQLTDVSLQCEVIWQEELGGTLTLALVARYPNRSFPDATEPLFRTIGLSWTYDLPTESCPVEPGECWRGDYGTLTDFRAGIEANPAWQWAVYREPALAEVVSQDD